MCDPLTAAIATAVVTTVGTGVSMVQQAKQAKAENKAILHQQEVAAEESRKTASSELFDQMRAARRDQAEIRTAAGEAGLSLTSGSIEGMLNDAAMQMELQGQRSIANMESRNTATDAQTESMLSQVNRPSLLSSGLQIASAAASGWSGVQSAKLQMTQASTPKGN